MIYVKNRALLVVGLGKTFSDSLKWSARKKVYKKITAASRTAPCILDIEDGHGMPAGWVFRISGVKGMVQLNEERYYAATVVSPNQIELNDVNAAEFPAYEGGGIIEYMQPADLTGMTARMQFRPSIDSATLYADLTTVNNRIVIAPAKSETLFHLTPTETAAIRALLPATAPANRAPDQGVFDIELVAADNSVPLWLQGDVHFFREGAR